MKRNTIICGDCVDVMATFPEESIDLVVTSPPYDKLREYQGFTFDYEATARQLWRVIKPGGVVVWVVADQTKDGSESGTSFRQALYFMSLGYRLHDTMFYQTNKPPLNHNRYEQCIEYMFVFSKGKPKSINLIREKSIYHGIDIRRKGKYTHNVRYKENKAMRNGKNRTSPKPTKIKSHLWYYKTGGGHSGDALAFNHPATFPEALARDHIYSWSIKGDVVLDPFVGSGTVPKMAIESGRDYIGIDLSAKYCELSRRRIERAKRLFVELL